MQHTFLHRQRLRLAVLCLILPAEAWGKTDAYDAVQGLGRAPYGTCTVIGKEAVSPDVTCETVHIFSCPAELAGIRGMRQKNTMVL